MRHRPTSVRCSGRGCRSARHDQESLFRRGLSPLGNHDTIATEAGCPVWVEKTPTHYAYVEKFHSLFTAAEQTDILNRLVAIEGLFDTPDGQAL